MMVKFGWIECQVNRRFILPPPEQLTGLEVALFAAAL